MGSWGAGIYDSDRALDAIDHIYLNIVKEGLPRKVFLDNKNSTTLGDILSKDLKINKTKKDIEELDKYKIHIISQIDIEKLESEINKYLISKVKSDNIEVAVTINTEEPIVLMHLLAYIGYDKIINENTKHNCSVPPGLYSMYRVCFEYIRIDAQTYFDLASRLKQIDHFEAYIRENIKIPPDTMKKHNQWLVEYINKTELNKVYNQDIALAVTRVYTETEASLLNEEILETTKKSKLTGSAIKPNNRV